MDDVLGRISPAVRSIVEFAGMDLVHLELTRQGGRLVLRVFIDKEGGVTLDDCALVSRRLSAQMDADDPIAERYTLEVSSPGIDRLLTRAIDFERFAGQDVRVTTSEPLAGRRHFTGRLTGLVDGIVHLLLEGGVEVAIPRERITRARLKGDDIAFGPKRGLRGRHA